MKQEFDLVVLGAGFAGSLMSMIARQLGLSVLLLERSQHPRFAIGESSTPLTNLLLEELARRYDLPGVLPLTKWGTWQAAQPGLGCGLKRGFTFLHHSFDQPWQSRADRSNELLVTASPHDGVADTHWYRPDFDHFLVQATQRMGVVYLDQTEIDRAKASPNGVELEARRYGTVLSFRANFVIDATGSRGCLRRLFGFDQSVPGVMPATQALFAHFRGVTRWDALHADEYGPPAQPPFPIDDAAVHHVFPGGWIWVLRFNNGLTSAGVVATTPLTRELDLATGAAAWQRLMERLPAVGAQFASAEPASAFGYLPAVAFRSPNVTGQSWALLPSAAGFIDPLFSTGFPLALLGIERLAEILAAGPTSSRLNDYENKTMVELELVDRLVASLYAQTSCAPSFNALTLLYFAAASFSETARRLGKPELAGRTFLAADHPTFGPALRACIDLQNVPEAMASDKLLARVQAAIKPIDVAGLGRGDRQNWFPIDPQDLYDAKEKLGTNRPELEAMLTGCGFLAAR